MCNWIADNICPPWLAPNTITVSALMLVIVCHILMMIYSPTMDSDMPAWLYTMTAICLHVYQILDVLDGKQARKTGNSSPMGLMFDHGCDAFNTVINVFSVCAAFKIGPSLLFLKYASVGFVMFYMATWEEYFTGTFALPVFNGPNEGLIAVEM
jgi:ethanolaminephosphotransferase